MKGERLAPACLSLDLDESPCVCCVLYCVYWFVDSRLSWLTFRVSGVVLPHMFKIVE